MEPIKAQKASSEKGQGFMPGVILGLVIGCAFFWATIKIIQVISY